MWRCGLKAGTEGAVHNIIAQYDEFCEVVGDSFALMEKRMAALVFWSARVLWSTFSHFMFHIYRGCAKLIFRGCDESRYRREEVSQVHPLYMSMLMYAI